MALRHSRPRKDHPVFINRLPAARFSDLHSCSTSISASSANVIVDGVKVQTYPISPEIPDWVDKVLLSVGLTATAVLAGPIVALLGLAGGMGGYAGAFIGGRLNERKLSPYQTWHQPGR